MDTSQAAETINLLEPSGRSALDRHPGWASAWGNSATSLRPTSGDKPPTPDTLPHVGQALIDAAQARWLPSPRQAPFHPVTRQQQTLRRASQRPPLADLVDRLPRGDSGDTDSYLGVLDRVLEDRIISADELATLSGLAAELGLKHDTAHRAHRQYLQHVAAAAWHDGHVTDAERADLLNVAHLLDVPPGEALTILHDTQHTPHRANGHEPPALSPSDKIVFTGDMDMNRADIEALATAAGLRVTSSVNSKTSLVVAADPYTQSGKASTAANSAYAWSPNKSSSTCSTTCSPPHKASPRSVEKLPGQGHGIRHFPGRQDKSERPVPADQAAHLIVEWTTEL